jgi:hypothetical protein
MALVAPTPRAIVAMMASASAGVRIRLRTADRIEHLAGSFVGQAEGFRR